MTTKRLHSLNRSCMFPLPQFIEKKPLSKYPHCDRALSLTAVSWQHRTDLNVLAIQLLASLHLSLHCGRVECTEWSDEDKLLINTYNGKN